jgi:hypothetical protein
MLHNVVLLHPEGCPHTLAVREPALLIYHSLVSLGIPARFSVNKLEHSAVNILLGYHFLYDPAPLRGHECVIYQLEQLSDDPAKGWFTPVALEVLRSVKMIWDYDERNVRFLKDKGLADVRYLPLGFHENLRTIEPAEQPDIDVLFYGSTNERRCRILDALRPHCRLVELFGVYGAPRDQNIARAKIVLNMHLHGMQIMEQVRLAYLINNGSFVLTEESAENPFAEMVVSCGYEELAAKCLEYLARDADRHTIARRGMELFRRRPMVEYLRRAMSQKPA